MPSSIISHFLQTITDECFDKRQSDRQPREKVFLKWRFSPIYRTKEHTEIAKMMTQEPTLKGQNLETSLTTTVGNVVKAIVKQYEGEMQASDVDTEALLTGGKGQHGHWKTVYDWLWNIEFPNWGRKQYTQWGEDWFLGALVENTSHQGEWIDFVPCDRTEITRMRGGIKREEKVVDTETLYLMNLNLPYPEHHLLLFNRTGENIHCICPSSDFAPIATLSGTKIQIPQEKAKYININFETIGREEFLAIVSNKIPPRTNLTSEQICQFWRDSLEEQASWQVFHDTFEVIQN